MINQNPKRSEEPIWWSLFGAGGTWFAMITPITIFVLGIMGPMGMLDADALSYDRVADFATNIIGALFVIATIALPIWHAMHRVHHGMHDLKIHTGVMGKVACYGIAAIISALAIVFIFMI
ncbi:fumarate reductase subunit FrdD [Vibrio gazogenes]|uniref:Fumarate reductase subunit D n=1 Tax=Vibrio gazogenes DSM 21264 = NBRC 103151 TaxID=1123492 RepID=A0A1M5D7K4_VIBGA|nr:fumarate reductase subunit FrdD [Vibrio gazogenes]USP13987.1 fumarate reductase subunit FrdD [Vibrio gazogenes]SHF62998.1 succinate dehydrogenase subunit D [Vibrio gazogenes DSM 21264] [Vibrio gazogenes DSM 21264 = NBRC 103151]SJN55025.1 Fumarate reductase subunit D [Vibrio gazogenes]